MSEASRLTSSRSSPILSQARSRETAHASAHDAGSPCELLHGEMRERAIAGRAVVHLAGPASAWTTKSGSVLTGNAGLTTMTRRGRTHQQDDGDKIALGVVRRLVAERGIGGDNPGPAWSKV